jgi:hypothetical protein
VKREHSLLPGDICRPGEAGSGIGSPTLLAPLRHFHYPALSLQPSSGLWDSPLGLPSSLALDLHKDLAAIATGSRVTKEDAGSYR